MDERQMVTIGIMIAFFALFLVLEIPYISYPVEEEPTTEPTEEGG